MELVIESFTDEYKMILYTGRRNIEAFMIIHDTFHRFRIILSHTFMNSLY